MKTNRERRWLACGFALLAAGILAAAAHGQAVMNPNNPNSTNIPTTGVQPVNDLMPLIILFTGPTNWDWVGSSQSFTNGATGVGTGQVFAASRAAVHGRAVAKAPWPSFAPIPAAAGQDSVASVTPAAPKASPASSKKRWPDFAPIPSASGD